jgi:hypothetical protein
MDRVIDSDTAGQATSAAIRDGGTARATSGGSAMPLLAIRGMPDGRCAVYCNEGDAVDRIPGGNEARAGPGRCPEVNDYA